MDLTDLLDELMKVGPSFASSPVKAGSAASDARNEVNAALLPVLQWLDGLKAHADQNDIGWVELDGAPSDQSLEAVKTAISVLKRAVDEGDLELVRSELTNFGDLLLAVAEETDSRLEELGIDGERRNRLLLPLNAHVSELAVTTGSSEALSLARKSLGEIGEKRLSEGIANKVSYEQKRADRFRNGAVVAFIVSIAWLIASYIAFRSPEISPGTERITQVVARLGIGAAVLGLALYLSRESRSHRNRASGWQNVELQMDTIGLYCASLPVEHRDAIRLSFGLEVFSGSKLFGSLDGTEMHQDTNGSSQTGRIDIDEVLSAVKALSRATR